MQLHLILALTAACMVSPGISQPFKENPGTCPATTPITGQSCSNPVSEDCQYTEADGSISRCTCYDGKIFACNSPFNNADPKNHENCPSVQPAIEGGESCSVPLGGGDCRYGEFIWPGSSEPTYVTICSCFDGTFACAEQSNPGDDPSNDVSCSSSVDCATFGNKTCQFLDGESVERCSCFEGEYLCYEPASQNGANPNNHPACPAKKPNILDACPNGPSDRDCLYDEFYFPGSNEITYITRASCFDGVFQIALQGAPLSDPNNNAACPFETPVDGATCPSSLAQRSCQYLSGSDKVVECDCLSTGKFECGKVFKPKAKSSNNPSCPRLEPSNMDACSFSGDCLYQEIPCFILVNYLKKYSCVDGKVMEADLNSQCPNTICFSGDSVVEVKDRGFVPMKELQINDEVQVGGDIFEPVYSFGHYNPTMIGHFLEIKTNQASLTVSADHMIFTKSGDFVPASSVRVGDKLIQASSGDDIVVESIRSVKKSGVFAPFTPSGKIVVNDVLASSFVSLGSHSGVQLLGSITVSYQWMAHMFEFPHRMACHYLGKCPNGAYTKEGISTWVAIPMEVSRWVLVQHPVIRSAILTSLVGVFCLFSILEACFLYPIFVIAAVMSLGAMQRRRLSKIKSQ